MSIFLIIFLSALSVAAASVILWLLLKKFYKKASRELSFVRTGLGGQKVVMNAGALVIPVLHETVPVNMQTLRLEVIRANNQALITHDRMRVDVQAEFYVRVKPTMEAVADAAQSLGRRTTDPSRLQELVEGRFVDALRAVAAEMDMDELHERRADFVQSVSATVSEHLATNGLELVSVSLSALDQTDQSYFNPQNAFDARGLTTLTEVIQTRMRRRNEVERDSEIAIARRDLESARQKLDLSKEEEFARLEQEREIQVRRAEQQATISLERAEKDRQAKEAEIMAGQQLERSQIIAERETEDHRIAKGFFLRKKEIEKDNATEVALVEKEGAVKEAQIASKQKIDQAQVEAERSVEQERISRELFLKQQEIAREEAITTAESEKQKVVVLADQEREIAIAMKSKELSAAKAEADKVRLSLIKAEEQVTTVLQTEVAERQRLVDLIETRKKVECEEVSITGGAEARKKAANAEADRVRIIAKGEAEKTSMAAKAEAEAEITRAEAAERRYSVDAAGKRVLHEAENVLDPNAIALRVKMTIIDRLPEIIRESVKPLENIEGIKIVQVDGLNRGTLSGTKNDDSAVPGSGNLTDQVVNSALRYRGQAPLVDAILKEIGISGGDIHGLTKTIKPESNDNDSSESDS